MATSLALRSDLNPMRVVRTLGDEYTGVWRDIKGILNKLVSVVSPEDYQHTKLILTKDCLSRLLFDKPKSNKPKMNARGSQKQVIDTPDLVNNIINKKDCWSQLMPLHAWVYT